MIVLSETTSVCPECLKRVNAAYVIKDGAVYLEKECGGHGRFSCLISRDIDDYKNWEADTVNIRPKEALRRAENGCPYDCGPCENHLQTACCVLIDVTGRCDQSCGVCFASASMKHGPEPGLAEIEQKFDRLVQMSETRKFNIQLSGGEPTVRGDLPGIVKMAKSKGFEYVQLNTNGKRIGLDGDYAPMLKRAGVDAVFMQFDGLSDDVYMNLRNEKLLDIKKKAVENCRGARLPVALVPTIARGVNDHEIGAIIRFMLENTDVIKGVHFQPMSFFGRYPEGFGEKQRFTMFDTINEIGRQTIIPKDDLIPISTGHPLCCFYATFLKREDGSISCTSAGGRLTGGCCDDEPSYTSLNPCCPDEREKELRCPAEEPCCPPDIEIISKDRDYVRDKWKMAERVSEDGFDAFLDHMRENSFTITGMAFQDAFSLDTDRLRRCRVQVLSEDGGLIPFCAYNLTDLDGNYLYRGERGRQSV